MYFSGTFSIDPSQITKIESVKPTKVFGKLFYFLTAGMVSEKQEHETFTAVTILQQLNMVMRSMGITNMVRLAQDDYDFYLDEKGKEDDLKEAMDEFEIRVDPLESELFKSLYTVLEHEDSELKYLIEIHVKRSHRVGEYPIVIKVNGIVNEFRQAQGEDSSGVRQRMASVFDKQEHYDQFILAKRTLFDRFLNEMEQSVRKFIRVDDIVKTSGTRIIRPKKRLHTSSQIRTRVTDTEPVYYGYYGFADSFFYAWLWADMAHHHNMYTHDVTVVDEAGHAMMDVGHEGFFAGETGTLNPGAEFEPPHSGEVAYHSGHEFDQEFSDSHVPVGGDIHQPESESSWLDSVSDSSWDDSDTSSSCSSCGACSGD